ncbi:hypothetical protein GHV44_26810, partial [Pseudomonas aeruginosa]|nr:hypothetical protein [Pseudomonas aeruginosa]
MPSILGHNYVGGARPPPRHPHPEVAEAFRITPLEAPLGAEVRGLDARRPLAPEQ